jgi:hypothetical protein
MQRLAPARFLNRAGKALLCIGVPFWGAVFDPGRVAASLFRDAAFS